MAPIPRHTRHASTPPAPARHAHVGNCCRGATLLEVGLTLGVVAAVVVSAMAMGQAWGRYLLPIEEATRVAYRVEALREAVGNWYRVRYCGSTSSGLPVFPIDGATAEAECAAAKEECATEGVQCPAARRNCDLELYVAPHLRRVVPARGDPSQGHGEFHWQIDVPPPVQDRVLLPPRTYVFWTPPQRFDHAALAHELEVGCDDDGVPNTREPCDGSPASERLVWSWPLTTQMGYNAVSIRRLHRWLARNAIDCDTTDDGRLDTFCDSQVDENGEQGELGGDNLLGPDPIDPDGDCCDNLRRPGGVVLSLCEPDVVVDDCNDALLDRDQDGKLDLDVNGDLAVDATDFHAFGC